MQHATGIHGSNGTTARANGFNLNHGRAHHQAKLNGRLRRQGRFALRYQGHIKRGAAHVARHHIGITGCTRNGGTRHHASSRPRQSRSNRNIASRLTRHHTAIALHNQQFAFKALAAQIRFQTRQITAHHGLQSGIQGSCGAALKLADFWQHFTGCCHVWVGPHGAHGCHSSLLIGHIGVGIDKEHAHRFTTRIEQSLRLCFHLAKVHRGVNLAIGQYTFVNLQAQGARHDGRETASQTPGLRPITAAHFQHITKTACGDDASARYFAF